MEYISKKVAAYGQFVLVSLQIQFQVGCYLSLVCLAVITKVLLFFVQNSTL